MLRALTLLYFELLIFKLSSPPAGLPSSRLFQDLLLPHPHHLQWLYKWIIIITENTHFATCSALRESHALFHVTLQQALEGKAIWPYLHILKLRSREAKSNGHWWPSGMNMGAQPKSPNTGNCSVMPWHHLPDNAGFLELCLNVLSWADWRCDQFPIRCMCMELFSYISADFGN